MGNRPTTDGNPHAARMEAMWWLVSSATTDEEFEEAKKACDRIEAMTDEELAALTARLGRTDREEEPGREKREGDLLTYLRDSN